MDKLNAYHALSMEDANMVDRYMVGPKTADQQDRLANLVLELRAQQPPVAIRAPNGDVIPVSPDQYVRIDPTRSSFRVEI